MYCPVCKTCPLIAVEPELNLRNLQCSNCGGHWLQSYHYWTWRSSRTADEIAHANTDQEELQAQDTAEAKVCIECGKLMSRFRVGKGMEFYLDRCGACGGIWFDRNEWEILKSRNLHDEIHKIFARPWQREIVQIDYDDRLKETIGPEKFRDLKSLKSWLDLDPNRTLILGYLEKLKRDG
jgi:Zn-finger nucleic acid-binding protein